MESRFAFASEIEVSVSDSLLQGSRYTLLMSPGLRMKQPSSDSWFSEVVQLKPVRAPNGNKHLFKNKSKTILLQTLQNEIQ